MEGGVVEEEGGDLLGLLAGLVALAAWSQLEEAGHCRPSSSIADEQPLSPHHHPRLPLPQLLRARGFLVLLSFNQNLTGL